VRRPRDRAKNFLLPAVVRRRLPRRTTAHVRSGSVIMMGRWAQAHRRGGGPVTQLLQRLLAGTSIDVDKVRLTFSGPIHNTDWPDVANFADFTSGGAGIDIAQGPTPITLDVQFDTPVDPADQIDMVDAPSYVLKPASINVT